MVSENAKCRGTIEDMRRLARKIRRDALAMIHAAGSGHPGGSLSCAEIMAVLVTRELGWFEVEELVPSCPRFILSKGHACPALYAAAAHAGWIPFSELSGFRKINGALQGHPHVLGTPWVETSTGSLGQGFSVAVGMALGFRYKGEAQRIYVLVGDGELQEGQIWEGAMCAGHYGLDNLCAVVDYNKMQSDDLNENIMGLEPLKAKWEAFRWHVIEVDGHDVKRLCGVFGEARQTTGKPTVILAHTVKGNGVSFMEGSPLWHGSVMIRDEELIRALRDLGTSEDEIALYLDGSIWEGAGDAQR